MKLNKYEINQDSFSLCLFLLDETVYQYVLFRPIKTCISYTSDKEGFTGLPPQKPVPLHLPSLSFLIGEITSYFCIQVYPLFYTVCVVNVVGILVICM